MVNSLASHYSMEEILFKRHETDMGCLGCLFWHRSSSLSQLKQCEAGLNYPSNTIGYSPTNDFGQCLVILFGIKV